MLKEKIIQTFSNITSYDMGEWVIKFGSIKYLVLNVVVVTIILTYFWDGDQVRFNNPSVNPAHFGTGRIGGDNAIARHGIHGLYWLYSIVVSSDHLVKGMNTFYLRSRATTPFQGVMYDYIRLESPPTLVCASCHGVL